jgi:hypothetical protein
VPRLIVAHGRVSDALKHVTGEPNTAKDFRKCIVLRRRSLQLDLQVHAVDLLPHLGRNRVTHRTRVLTGGTQARVDRIRILFVEREVPDHLFFGRIPIAFLEDFCIAGGIDQRLPLMRRRERQVQLQVKIDADEACDIFRALDVTRHPMHRVRNAT